MTEDAPIYLVYLADTEGDQVSFAVFTHSNRRTDDWHETRVPSLVSLEKTNTALYTLDRPLRIITNRSQFWEWLDGRSGWAAFRPESAAQLIPHWVGDSVQYECTRLRLGAVEFVESSCLGDLATADVYFELTGPELDSGAFAWFTQITGNLVASRRKVAARQAEPGAAADGPRL